MNSFRIITTSCLLFLVLQLPGPGGANPLHPAMPKADLMDFKTLLDNLEDQIPPEDPDMPPQMLAEQNEEAEAERQTWPQEADGIQRDRGLVPRDPVSADESSVPLRTKLRPFSRPLVVLGGPAVLGVGSTGSEAILDWAVTASGFKNNGHKEKAAWPGPSLPASLQSPPTASPGSLLGASGPVAAALCSELNALQLHCATPRT
ncbi:natriuretic peptides A [Suncus etruscus]|uniref:natriuretic peptides A n=1 Tax=Suncus etruscus TaxID=109475 RepID=UPI00210F6A24|nr:natriuretic peptides A [Suncus etruscus]